MKKSHITLIILLIIVILVSACSEDNTTEPQPSPSIQVPTSKPSDIQAKVFTQSCTSSGCHGNTNNQASLLLTEGSSYANLVNVQSVLYPQFTRVQPGNSSNSLLIKILKGEV